ncbi:MAG: DUF4920 domain-containing protein [Balneolaceae bacterium]
MKNILLLLAGFLIASTAYAQQAEVIRLSEPVQQTENYEVFGAEVETWEAAESLSSVIEAGETFIGKEITLETEVAQVCEKKGCFFVANDGSKSARITFKDYGFFIPTDSQGKNVKLVGVFNVKELSEEQAKHYAEDAGNDPEEISGTQKEYSIVATSVLVPKSK